ncbi:MAG: ABC transporter permease [Clostridiales Family XIII bacterium]|jgi:ribose/xylose/arabinose/galactoside ABC-type transport system permease subunit|nr:ABC transporter permease [Clostridiales Family XIII bacterium]
MNNVKGFLKEYAIGAFLLLIIVIMSILKPTIFLTVGNFVNILDQVAINGILTVGILFVMLAQGIDLSVGGMMAFSGVVGAKIITVFGIPYPLAVIVVLIICVLVGCLQGYIIVNTGIFPMIGTLAMMGVLGGAAYVISKGQYIIFPDNMDISFLGQGRIGGLIPVSVLVLLIVLVVASIVLNKTFFGRYFYLVGSNSEAARLSGIQTKLVQIVSYGISGLFASFAGIIYMSRLGSGSAQIYTGGWEMSCLTAAVIGGVSLMGGEGKVIKAFIGVLIIGVLTTSMIMLGIDAYAQKIVTGIVFLAAVCFDGISKQMATNAKMKIEEPAKQAG